MADDPLATGEEILTGVDNALESGEPETAQTLLGEFRKWLETQSQSSTLNREVQSLKTEAESLRKEMEQMRAENLAAQSTPPAPLPSQPPSNPAAEPDPEPIRTEQTEQTLTPPSGISPTGNPASVENPPAEPQAQARPKRKAL